MALERVVNGTRVGVKVRAPLTVAQLQGVQFPSNARRHRLLGWTSWGGG